MNFDEHLKAHKDALVELTKAIGIVEQVGKKIISTFERGNKLLIAGNGGSASDAQHFAAELVGRFKAERTGLPAIALTTDTSILTAVGNDYGYENIFSRQVMALGDEGDLFIGISTSGRSANILEAFKACKQKRVGTICLTGNGNKEIDSLVDKTLRIESNDTAIIQEMHITLIHMLCSLMDTWVIEND